MLRSSAILPKIIILQRRKGRYSILDVSQFQSVSEFGSPRGQAPTGPSYFLRDYHRAGRLWPSICPGQALRDDVAARLQSGSQKSGKPDLSHVPGVWQRVNCPHPRAGSWVLLCDKPSQGLHSSGVGQKAQPGLGSSIHTDISLFTR